MIKSVHFKKMRIGINFYPDLIKLPLGNLKEDILNEANLRFERQISAEGIVAWMPLPVKNGFWDHEGFLSWISFLNPGLQGSLQ